MGGVVNDTGGPRAIGGAPSNNLDGSPLQEQHVPDPHTGNGAGVRDAELAAEQRYLDAAYDRLDEMRRRARQVAEGYADVGRGGTHQARLERDAAAANTRRRLAALDIGDMPLCFGRLDLAPTTDLPDTGPYYVGRIAVTDEEQEPLIVDWRAPVAEPFYRATAIAPMGVARRRHFQTRGRELHGIDDEVFAPDVVEASGATVVGDGGFLHEVLERERTGRMHDIVATIQAEQDEAIRADLPGALIVAGGPGTGKTAVALHRAAYLLYTHRRRLAARGVLLVGPNAMFLHYIDEVLPALGEDEVQLATATGLKPQLRARRRDTVDVAAVKGDARMATVVAKALEDREHPLARDLVVTLDGHRLRLARRDSARIVERARRRRGSHNERRPLVARMVLDHLREQYRRSLVAAYQRHSLDEPAPSLFRADEPVVDVPVAAALARGRRAPDEWEQELAGRIRRLPDVRATVDRMWPVLTGAELIHDLCSFVPLIRSASDGVLSRREQAMLFRARSENVRDVAWTESDVALVDEADALLGPPEAARPARRRSRRGGAGAEELATARRVVEDLGLGGWTNADEIARRYSDDAAAPRGGGRGVGREDGDDSATRTFGHVLVDEAQDLTPMEWRMLARRCPSGSMTLVGDFGQSTRPGAADGWDAVRAHLPDHRGFRHVTLTVNYRTPAEIMEVADRVLAAAAPGVEPPRSVRSTGEPARFEAVASNELIEAVAAEARAARVEAGTVAVLAPPAFHEAIVAALRADGAVAGTADALDAPIAVLAAEEAKGLEFDHVVVVEPARLVTPDSSGLRLLYVTLTRATRTLTVLHAEALPEALEPASTTTSPTTTGPTTTGPTTTRTGAA